MISDLPGRRRLAELIQEHSPKGITEQDLLDKLRAEGYCGVRDKLHGWIIDMRSAGLVLANGYNGWRITTQEERAGAGAAWMAAVEQWDYEFTPQAVGQAHAAVRELFANMAARQVMTFTAAEFASFRDALAVRGVELHEVTRVPHFEPEIVG